MASFAVSNKPKASLAPINGHIPALDGLRGFAALFVVFHHCFIWPMLFSKGIISPEPFQLAYGSLLLPTALWYGYSGVELFFILSGFCLLYQVFSQPHRTFSVRKYAFHRVRRIYPPYFGAVVLAVVLAAIAWSKIDAHLHWATEPVSFSGVISALTLTGSHYCLPFWSLVIEAQWYFLVPVLAILFARSRWLMHGGMLGCIALLAVLETLQIYRLHTLLVYLPLFWIGILLADIATMEGRHTRLLLQRGLWLVLVATGMIAIYMYAPPPPVWKQSASQAYPVAIFYTGVLSAALFTRFGQRVFSARWLVKAGAFSYSLYLIHALVVYVAVVLMDHYRISGTRELIICLTALPAICIATGYVFYLAIEKRVMRRSVRAGSPVQPPQPLRARIRESNHEHRFIGHTFRKKPFGIITAQPLRTEALNMPRFFAAFLSLSLASLIPFCEARAQSSQKPDLTKQPTLYVVGYAHLDTEWRWEYPQVINEYIRKTMEDNFKLFDKYPHYIFNFSGANRYRFMKEYFPADFAKVKSYVDSGRWFPAGSSMEEGDVNAPSAESIIRQVLYGNNWFRKELGKASAEYMLPDCFGFPASLPTILAHAGVKGFSTQKLVWGSSADGGGPESREKTPDGTPFNVGVWVGPDGESVLAGLNPGSYSGGIETDLSKPLPPAPPNATLQEIQKKLQALRQKLEAAQKSGAAFDHKDVQDYIALQKQEQAFAKFQEDQDQDRYQGDWAARVENNGKVSGVYTDYHYYGTGDTGGSPDEDSVKRLEAIVTKGTASLPPEGEFFFRGEKHPEWPAVKVGDGPVHVISSTAEQMFLDITQAEAAGLPRYTGEMELTNHSAGSLTSQAYQKRWLRKEELLADAAEKGSIAAEWLGARPYPLQRLNDAWTLVMGGQFHDIAAGTATPKAYEFAWNDDVIAMNQFADVLNDATEAVAAALDTRTKGVPVVVFNPLNIAREDLVEASVDFPGGMPDAVHVTGPNGDSSRADFEWEGAVCGQCRHRSAMPSMTCSPALARQTAICKYPRTLSRTSTIA